MFPPPPQTDRLILRRFVPADAEAFYELLGDAEAMKYFPRPFSRRDADLWVERQQQRYAIFGYGLWAVTLRESGELLGNCGPAWHEVQDELQLEVGYHFIRRHWGHGYATEAARAVMAWVFGNIPVDHLISLVRPENAASRRVAKRNGLVATKSVNWRGLEHMVYRMDRADWDVARKEDACR